MNVSEKFVIDEASKEYKVVVDRLNEASIYGEIGTITSTAVEMLNSITRIFNVAKNKPVDLFYYQQVRAIGYNMLYRYFIIPNNNKVDIFKENINDIVDILKKLSDDTANLMHYNILKIQNSKDYKVSQFNSYCEAIGKDLWMLKIYSGF